MREFIEMLHHKVEKLVVDGMSIDEACASVFGRLEEEFPELCESILPK